MASRWQAIGPWHRWRLFTLWLAVDDSTPTNGCMRVIPGTHRMELHEMQRSIDVPNVLSSHMDPALVDESKAVDFVLKAGDVSVHHPNIIHGSNPNTLGTAALWFDYPLYPNQHKNNFRGTLALCISTTWRGRT